MSRATPYRRRQPRRPPGERPARAVAVHPASLSAAERDRLLAVLHGDRFVDKAPAQVWAVLLDEGDGRCPEGAD
jgi:hypothetical protein